MVYLIKPISPEVFCNIEDISLNTYMWTHDNLCIYIYQFKVDTGSISLNSNISGNKQYINNLETPPWSGNIALSTQVNFLYISLISWSRLTCV